MSSDFEERMRRAKAEAERATSQGDDALDAAKQAAKDPLTGAADTGKLAAKGGYKKIKYGVIDFFKKVAEWAVGTKVAKTIKAVAKYSGWTWLWNKTKPSKWSWKKVDAQETPWQTFKKRCKKVMGIATHAWLLAWPLSIVPGLKSVPVAGDLAVGAQEIGRYWTWEPLTDIGRMSLGAIKGDGFIKKEVVYLNSKSQKDIEADIWGVQGTRQKGSMDAKDAAFYKAENRLVCQIWNIFNHGSLWLARDKTAPILIGGDDQPSEVLSFGGDWRFATWFQAKPYFLEMRPVSNDFNTEASTQQRTTTPTPVQQVTPVTPAPATR